MLVKYNMLVKDMLVKDMLVKDMLVLLKIFWIIMDELSDLVKEELRQVKPLKS